MRHVVIDVIVDNLRKTSVLAFIGGAVVVIVSIFLNVSCQLHVGILPIISTDMMIF